MGGGRTLASVLVETNVAVDGANTLFARAEYVRKQARDLAVPAVPPDAAYDVGALSLGYLRELCGVGGARLGVGMRGAVSFVPARLESLYGARAPLGAAGYVRLRPPRMSP